MSRFTDNLLKAVGIGVILYGVYKLGEKNYFGLEEEVIPKKNDDKVKSEIDEINEIVRGIKQKNVKNRRDRDNLQLLEIKLKQLNKQK